MPNALDKAGRVQMPDRIDADFLERLRTIVPGEEDMRFTRKCYGDNLPSDILETLARQQALARPILDQYFAIYERVPSLDQAQDAFYTNADDIAAIMDTIDIAGLDGQDNGEKTR